MGKDSTTLMDDEMKRMFDKIARTQEQRERASIRSLREKINADSDKDFIKILLTKWWDEADVFDIEDDYWKQSDSFDEGIRTAARQIAEHITLAIVYADNMDDALTGLVEWCKGKRKTLDDRLGSMASVHLRAQRIKRTEIEITMLEHLQQQVRDNFPNIGKFAPATDNVPSRPQGRPSTKDETISADVQKIFDEAVRDGLMEKTDDGYKWIYNRGSNASLSYFISIVYNWVEESPQWALMDSLFGKDNLKQSYSNVTQAKKKQKWRKALDYFLEDCKREDCQG